tara:strand:+ start:44 stop:193 length:150 start_codon:yes stop_codon:yes gene_type:complete
LVDDCGFIHQTRGIAEPGLHPVEQVGMPSSFQGLELVGYIEQLTAQAYF